MSLLRTGIAVVAGALGSGAITAVGVSAPRSSTPAHSPPVTSTSLLANAHPSLTARASHSKTRSAPGIGNAALSDVVKNFCTGCHNPDRLRGNLDLTGY